MHEIIFGVIAFLAIIIGTTLGWTIGLHIIYEIRWKKFCGQQFFVRGLLEGRERPYSTTDQFDQAFEQAWKEWKRGQQIMRPNSPSEPPTERQPEKPPERVNQNWAKTESHNNPLPPIVALTSPRLSNAPNPLAEGQTVNKNKYNLTNENYRPNRKTSSNF